MGDEGAVLKVSVSGGRTSGYMAWWISRNAGEVADYLGCDQGHLRVVYVFANTGMEHDETLRFVASLGRNFGLPITWVEAVVHHGERRSSSHRVVTHETAFRNDQWLNPLHPFHAVISKYGVPNVRHKRCTTELKRNPMNSYMRSLGYAPNTYHTAIGIREDESRRVAKSAGVEKIVYPLIDLVPTRKEEINDWWSQFDWDLDIPEHLGNCVTCYKKSYRKLGMVYRAMPEAFAFNAHMEDAYKQVGPAEADRVFFRLNTDTRSLLAQFDSMAAVDFSAYSGSVDNDGGCSESCELYETTVQLGLFGDVTTEEPTP